MPSKTTILQDLGEADLLLPALIDQALAANDRTKYYFSLLQAARAHADVPDAQASDLRAERLAAGIEDRGLDQVVAGAARGDGETYDIPRSADIRDAIHDGIATMIAALPGDDGADFAGRLDKLTPALAAEADLDGPTIDRMTAGDRDKGDSPHILVMDLHKAINRLQADIAEENLDGAKVYRLSETSRPLVAAFMRGLNRTAPLKFDHPGLDTTATDANGRLMIQNDIGTTDAHVLVITVENRTATLTYTDIHERRLDFFRGLFHAYAVEWDAVRQKKRPEFESGAYHLATGVFRAPDDAALADYLAFLGSRIVFLIDWNKARKRLRNFVGNGEAISLLTWAAENDFGHRGFLEVGGERPVFEAIELCAGPRLRYGDRLDGLLGLEAARSYLQTVLKNASEGLRAVRSHRLIRDEMKIELLKYFESAQQDLLRLAMRHAGYTSEIAQAVAEGLAASPGDAAITAAAQRCRDWEQRADDLLNQARQEIRRSGSPAILLRFFERLDDAADGLEDAAFLLSLTAKHRPTPSLFPPVAELASLLVEAGHEIVKGLASAQHVARGGPGEDVDDLFQTLDRILEIEHRADDALRRASATAVAEAADFRDLHVVLRLAEALEKASDALALAAQNLRTFILDEVLAI